MGSQWPSPAASETIAKKRDRRSKPSKCRCALCSTTAIPSEDGCKTAYLPAVFDLRKAQPAAAIKARFKTNKHEYP